MQPNYIEEGYCPREPCARLPATYINHYCANGGVVCPQFGGIAAEADKKALEVLQEAYGPDYKVRIVGAPPAVRLQAELPADLHSCCVPSETKCRRTSSCQ